LATVALGEVMLAATATYAKPPPEPPSGDSKRIVQEDTTSGLSRPDHNKGLGASTDPRDDSKRTVQEDTTSGLSRPDHNKGLGASTGIGKVADWSAETWARVATPVIAGLALMLSTYNLYVQRRDLRPRLLIDASDVFSPLVPKGGSLVVLSVYNSGRVVPVTLSELYIPLKNGEKFHWGDDSPVGVSDPTILPQKIEPGEGISLYMNIADLKRAMQDAGYRGQAWVKVVAVDQPGRTLLKSTLVVSVDDEPPGFLPQLRKKLFEWRLKWRLKYERR
jgi:hypothetical protein